MDPLYDEPPLPRTLEELDEFKNAERRQIVAQLAAGIPRADVARAHDLFASLDPKGIVIRFDLINNRA